MAMVLDFSSVLDQWPLFLDGARLTLELSLIATVTGFVAGTACAIAMRRGGWVARLCNIYVEAIRNTPLLVQIFLMYFGLASLGLHLSAFVVASISLTVNVAAYTAEIMRAGLEAIPAGQVEAGECLGLSRVQLYRHVLLLPAMERVYPSLASQFVLLMLASSVTSQISAEELTAVANHVQSETFRPFETFILLAGIYIVLSLVMRLGFAVLAYVIFPRRRRLRTALA
jgi:polar amino acid transport system permease protein